MIRIATDADLLQIAKVHSECFPNSFSTKLGDGNGYKLLQRFYKEYLDIVSELFLVAINDDNKIIGFCMGYYCENNNFQRNFLKHNIFFISVKMACMIISGNKFAWKKILPKSKIKEKILDEQYSEISLSKKGDLLSISVLPQYRGSGIAADLIKQFEKTLKAKGKRYCQLTVDTVNTRGIHFYDKMGYVKYKENREKITYYKSI